MNSHKHSTMVYIRLSPLAVSAPITHLVNLATSLICYKILADHILWRTENAHFQVVCSNFLACYFLLLVYLSQWCPATTAIMKHSMTSTQWKISDLLLLWQYPITPHTTDSRPHWYAHEQSFSSFCSSSTLSALSTFFTHTIVCTWKTSDFSSTPHLDDTRMTRPPCGTTASINNAHTSFNTALFVCSVS